MLSLWSAFYCSKHKNQTIQLNPKQFLTKLGNSCNSCNKKITYSTSISICDCTMYGHLQCIKKHLNTLKLKESDLPTCISCNKSPEITFEKQFKIGMNIKLQNSLLIILLCISIAFLLTSIKEQYQFRPSQRNLIMLSLEMFFIIVLFIGLLVLGFMSVVYSHFRVKDIKKTKNQVIASAFEGILTHRDSEDSSNVIFT